MKAKVNGAEVEGTPEEIAQILGFKYYPKPVIDYDDFLVKHEQDDPCKNCPRQGKNCDPQRCL